MLNKKLSKKGFSLIELMVAVTILAIVVLGIFLAFSNAWMGMANARDRTVATNYAREAMENVKNMDFEMVTNEELGTAESVGAKFTRVIIVNIESNNLKEIDTKVFWTNRQGQSVSVDTEMYISRTILNPGAATHLNLYADPYYTVLPSAGTSNIIAIIKDSNGNTKIDWDGGDIHFTILGVGYSDFDKGAIGSFLGQLGSGFDATSATTNEGRAEINFTADGYEVDGDLAQGIVVIEASVDLPNGGGTISDTITITVTLDVVRIDLSADSYSIDADGTSISTVTAALVNSGGETVVAASNEITFNISGAVGTFVKYEDESPLANTVTLLPSAGIARIKVKSITDTPGVATVIASSEGLIIGTINITTTGDAASISVSVDPDLIYIDGPGAMVTVEIQDINGNPVEYTGPIDLSISGGTGTFDANPIGPAVAYSTFFHPASSGLITITANGGGLTGSAIIDVRDALTADTISLSAIPKNILAGGDADSKITATIKQGSTVISNYSNPITFEIITDTSIPPSASLFYNSSNMSYQGIGPFDVPGEDVDEGKVVVYLSPSNDVGICTIEVSTYNSDDLLIVKTIEVGFYSSEHHIKLKAFPSKMLVNGGSCTVTAEVVDESGTLIETYNEDITFTILVGWPKIAKFAATGTSSLTTTLDGGEIDVDLIPQKEAGTVTLKASSFTGMTNITGYLNIPVITALTDLELALEPDITYNENQVSFDINVQGADLFLEEMQISWSLDELETLNKIEIKSPDTADPAVTVFDDSTNPASSGELIDVDNITLLAGISNVKLTFNESMSGKTLEVIFKSSSVNYPVEINDPLI